MPLDSQVIASWQRRDGAPSPSQIGGKAHGLWLLPSDWTPSFVILCLSPTERLGEVAAALAALPAEERAAIEQLLALANEPGASGQVIVRSNAPDEARPEHRGRFESHVATATMAAMAAEVARARGQQGAAIPVLVQLHVPAVAVGHLSNERRISRRRNAWCVDIGAAGTTDVLAASSRVDPKPLVASNPGELQVRLREVAGRLITRPARMHCEWVWDGARVWIVQADPIPAVRGEADAYLASQDGLPALAKAQPRWMQRLTAEEARRWSKLQRAAVMSELGMPTAPIYFLGGAECAELESHAEAFDADFALLSANGQIPVVLRCDVAVDAGRDSLSLRTSEPLDDAAQARAFIAGVRAEFAHAGVAAHHWAVLPARLVPARASVMIQAQPRAQTIRLDALWGFPDGVSCLDHDSFAYRIDRDEVRETRMCKGLCLLHDRELGWRFATVGEPHDWGRVLADDEIGLAASWARRIADHLGREVQLMVLARIGGTRGAAAMVPWHYTDHVVPAAPKPVGRAPADAAIVRRPSDLRDLQTEPPPSGLRFAPDVEERRKPPFIADVGATAAAFGIPVYFSGSVLGHAYYMLRRAGAHVICVGIERRPFEPDQYDKLVRDRIPEVVRQSGALVRVVPATPEQAVGLLKQKLVEEALEVWGAEGDDVAGELADLLEVVSALMRRRGIDPEEVERVQARKRDSHGGFERLLYLESTAAAETEAEPAATTLFSFAGDGTAPAPARRADPATVERWEPPHVTLRIPAVAPLRHGVALREYVVEVPGARLLFRHVGLEIELRVEPLDVPRASGQLSFAIET